MADDTGSLKSLTASPSPAKRKGARTRERLIEAAASLLARDGYTAFRVLDVCAAAGVSAGAFYAHFEDRDSLCEEVLLRIIDRLTDEIMISAAGLDPFPAILATNRRYIGLFERAGPLNRAVQQLVDQSPKVRDAWRAANARIAVHVVKGASRRLGRPLDPAIAYAAQAMLDGVLLQYFAWEDDGVQNAFGDPEALALKLSVLWHRLIYSVDPAGRNL